MVKQNLKIGDVVQVGDSDFGWSGCLLVVTKVEPWGVDGIVVLNEAVKRLRPTWDMIELVGKSVWFPDVDTEEPDDDLAEKLGLALSDYDIEED